MDLNRPPPGFPASKPSVYYSNLVPNTFDENVLSLSLSDLNLKRNSISQASSTRFDSEASPSSSNEVEPVSLDTKGILDKLPTLSRTKNGSKRTQQLIAKSRPEEIQEVIDCLKPHIGDLMCDTYGNYMCQTLFQSCSSQQRLSLLEAMKEQLISIATDPKGTHSLQNLVSLTSLPEEETIYHRSFSGNIMYLSTHQHASHVVQKMLVTLQKKHFVIREIVRHAKQLAQDKLGLCVIKKCVQDPQVFAELQSDPLILMQDPYGNYAMQLMVETWMEECSLSLMSVLKGRCAQLCIQKYASNVMEKCMIEEKLRRFIIEELISEDKVPLLLNCPYGCYVLRTAALHAETDLKKKLKNVIGSVLPKLQQKKLKSRWDEILKYLN